MRLFIVTAAFLIAGCVSDSASHKADVSQDRLQVRQSLDPEISLKADRQKLDDLRKHEPEEKKQADDELAFFLTQTQDLKQDPQLLRERFQTLTQKKRSRFNGIVDHLRKDYDKEERRRKDDFNSQQDQRRADIKQKKLPPAKVHEVYSQMEKDRLDFYSAERDRRKDFDDEIRNKSKEFTDYMKERTDEFNEQMRIYAKRYDEAKKQKSRESAPNSEPVAP